MNDIPSGTPVNVANNSPSTSWVAIWTRFVRFLRSFKVIISIYLAITISILFFIYTNASGFFSSFGVSGTSKDFDSYYWAAKSFFQDPTLIYQSNFLWSEYQVYPYRYFPALCIILYPLTLFPPAEAFLIFSGGSLFLSIFNIFLIYDIIQLHSNGKVPPKFTVLCTTCFCLPFLYTTVATGQNSNYVAFLLIFSLYNYVKQREMAGSLLLGFSVAIKPVGLFQIVFVVLSLCQRKTLKSCFKRILYIVLPLLPDLLLFIFVPNLFRGFIQVDFVEFARKGAFPDFILSVSFSNFLIVWFNGNSNAVLISLSITFCAIGIFFIWKLQDQWSRILFSFLYGAVVYFVVQTDIWETQYSYLYTFLILVGTLASFRKEKPFYGLLILYDLINLLPPLFYNTIDPSLSWNLHVYYCACGIISLLFTLYVLQYFRKSQYFLKSPVKNTPPMVKP